MMVKFKFMAVVIVTIIQYPPAWFRAVSNWITVNAGG